MKMTPRSLSWDLNTSEGDNTFLVIRSDSYRRGTTFSFFMIFFLRVLMFTNLVCLPIIFPSPTPITSSTLGTTKNNAEDAAPKSMDDDDGSPPVEDDDQRPRPGP